MSSRKVVRVRDVMNTTFDVVDGLDTVAQALMSAQNLDTNKCMIVLKRDADDEYGMVLLSDIAKQVLSKDRAPERVNIYEIMNKPVVSVSPHMDIRYCARMFEQYGLTRAPVIENEEIVGVVGHTDIVLHGLRDKLLS